MGIAKEFRDFAMRGNVIDLAVGVIIGGAFGAITTSLVNDVMMPPIGYLLGGVDFSDLKWTLAPERDATSLLSSVSAVVGLDGGTTQPAAAAVKKLPAVVISYGKFINVLINFLLVAFCLFMVIKVMNEIKRRTEKAAAAAPPPPPPGPTKEELLLGEIRDILKARG
jgi:large conductance mechanosensitive channel